MDIKHIGIASDHGGYDLKEFLVNKLEEDGYDIIDFGNSRLNEEDDFPDYVIPMARAVLTGELDRGIAVCGSGVGACVAVNKLNGIRACLITDAFSAHQGVEDDNMNVICLGGRITGHELAWEVVRIFLSARYNGTEKHERRLAKIAKLESDL